MDNASCLFLLVGCQQMFHGITKKRAVRAQQGMILFQISTIISMTELFIGALDYDFLFTVAPFQITMLGLPVIEVINSLWEFQIKKLGRNFFFGKLF